MIQVENVTDFGPVVRLRVARRIPGLSPYFTAAYWVDGLLVDTGCAHTAGQLTSALEHWRVDQAVNTHSHEDHIGANAEVQDLFRCPILAHPDALPILADPRLQSLQPYRRLFWGWPGPSQGKPIGGRVYTEQFRFQVIHTPGHSPDHVCLFEPTQGWLFSGDAFIGGQERALREDYDVQATIASLKALAELPVETIFSGSGTVRANGRQALQDKIASLEELGERIRSLRDEGLSPRRIRRHLLGSEPAITYLTLGHFSGMHLVHSYLADPHPEKPLVVSTTVDGEREDA